MDGCESGARKRKASLVDVDDCIDIDPEDALEVVLALLDELDQLEATHVTGQPFPARHEEIIAHVATMTMILYEVRWVFDVSVCKGLSHYFLLFVSLPLYGSSIAVGTCAFATHASLTTDVGRVSR